jgi:hypothetical protein
MFNFTDTVNILPATIMGTENPQYGEAELRELLEELLEEVAGHEARHVVEAAKIAGYKGLHLQHEARHVLAEAKIAGHEAVSASQEAGWRPRWPA